MSAHCLQLIRCHTQRLSMRNIYRQFQTSVLCLSNDIFHVQDEADFQKQVLDSRKPFMVNFHASW
jgi:hypothetical protein